VEGGRCRILFRSNAVLTTLLLALLFSADPPPPAPAAAATPAEAPIKLEATNRSGYALVTITPADKLTIKQANFITFFIPPANATTTSAPIPITFDQLGNSTIVVTLPPVGTVVVYADALMSDGKTDTLSQPTAIEVSAAPAPTSPTIPTAPGTPTPPAGPSPAAPLAAEKNLRVTLVVNLAAPGQPERDLIQLGSATAQSIKQALGGLGHTWSVADANSTLFQQALALARQKNPNVPAPGDTPFLFIERAADRSFVAAFKLNLSQDPRANANAILALFGAKF
jgi:hypothetical protein